MKAEEATGTVGTIETTKRQDNGQRQRDTSAPWGAVMYTHTSLQRYCTGNDEPHQPLRNTAAVDYKARYPTSVRQ